MEQAESRLRRLVRVYITDYLPALLGLLADEGVERTEQLKRADRLVRSLLGARLEANLTHNGRRLIVEVDDDQEPPALTFNGSFVENVDASEAFGLFETPTAKILGISPVRIGLVLGLEEEDDRNKLLNRARRHGETDPIGLADIPAVVEARLRVFVKRLRQLCGELTDETDLEVDLRSGVKAVVTSDQTRWPGWETMAGSSYMQTILMQLEDRFADRPELPSSETAAEMCWESLDLSVASFLRHAARLLRSERNDALDIERILRTVVSIVDAPGVEVSEDVADWPKLADLNQAWRQLFRSEQQMLSWTVTRRRTPGLSVFEPPLSSLRLNEPESLPWECPLLGWSTREQGALEDLLDGIRKTIEGKLDADAEEEPSWDPSTPSALNLEGESDFAIRMTGELKEPDEQQRRRTRRAMEACYGSMLERFQGLSGPDQKQMLQRVRSCYDGYFAQSNDVWDRRFQAWPHMEPDVAFTLLLKELEHVLGPRAMIDPFESMESGTPRQIPCFSFVVPYGQQEALGQLRLPLVALSASFDEAPTRLRAVEVPDESDEPCRWLGDLAVTMRTLVEQPTEKVLKNIRDDSVALQVERQ